MTISIRMLAPSEIPVLAQSLVRVYGEAFRPPPYNKADAETAGFIMSLERQVEREDLRFAAAEDDGSGELVGFAYGFAGRPGQWWYEHVARELTPETVERWLAGSFELVELAVTPRAQGQGVGTRLHDTVLTGLAHRTAMLSTMAAETVAFRLYRKWGWVTLVNQMYFPGVDRPYRIMGLTLADWRPRSASAGSPAGGAG